MEHEAQVKKFKPEDMMDIVAALKSEEKKLETRLGGIRQAIRALNGYAPRATNRMPSEIESSDHGGKLRGKKLSASHRRAIKVGIAKSKARKAGSK
jgi:hypothetical protein